jgi:hypothetical protein
VRNAPALQRRCGARGAHVASSMVDERLKGPFCLQRAVEGPTVKYPRASSYTRQPKVPRGILEPRSAVGLMAWAGFLVCALGAISRSRTSTANPPLLPLPQQQSEFCCATRCPMLGACTHKSAFCKRGSVNVRFAPKAAEVPRCRGGAKEMLWFSIRYELKRNTVHAITKPCPYRKLRTADRDRESVDTRCR